MTLTVGTSYTRVPTCIRVLHEGSQRLGVNVLDLDLLHAGLAHVVHEHGGEVVGGGGQHQAVGGQAAGASHQHHVAQLALRGARLHLAHQALRVVVGTELVAGSLVRHARRCQGVGATGGGVRVLQRAAGALEAGIGVVHQVPVIKQEKNRNVRCGRSGALPEGEVGGRKERGQRVMEGRTLSARREGARRDLKKDVHFESMYFVRRRLLWPRSNQSCGIKYEHSQCLVSRQGTSQYYM